ncbi:hypothetical protein DVH05_018223 [Phytophthora capsici]|nr:hypothetical protein DVH05_018223 [Phytophthora capsici]
MPPKRNKEKPDHTKHVHTTITQLRGMVEWVEDGSNYDIIRGEFTTGKSMGHGNGITKIAGFGLMAEHVHSVVMADMQATGVFDARHAQKWDAATCQS